MEKYGVDLDGTLARYDGWRGSHHIGEAVPSMLARVKQWIEDGIEVVIFTARANDPDNIPRVAEWLKANDLPNLEITNIKSPDISRIYDDRAVHVKKNTGVCVGEDTLTEWIDFKTSKLWEMYFHG